MASIRPINLAAPSTTIGAMPPELIAAMQRQQAMQSPGQSMAQQTQDFTREARSQALIDALDAGMTGPLHGGGWGEALARFGESYLRTRSGARGHERDLRAEALARDQDQEDRKLRNRSALAEALGQEQENTRGPETWSDIPTDQLPPGARFGQRNSRTNEANMDYEPAPVAGMTQWGPMTPQLQQQYPNLNPGDFQVNETTGEFRQIPGATQRARATTQQATRARAALARIDDQQTVLGAIGRARSLAGEGETGAVGSVMRHLPWTRAGDLNAELDVIRANMGFDALMEMRANSPTGGALGAVTERELALLQSVLENLDQARDTNRFNAALDRLEQTYINAMANIRTAYEQDFGEPMPMPTAPAGGDSGGGLATSGGAASGALTPEQIERRIQELQAARATLTGGQ